MKKIWSLSMIIFPLLLILLLPITGCAPRLTDTQIADLQRLPQDPAAYLDPETADRPLFSKETQQALAAELLANIFAPWQASTPLETTLTPYWAADWLRQNAAYGINLQPLTAAERETLIARAAPEHYPSLDRNAISLHRCNLRALPTRHPVYKDPDRPGEGFPFDVLQHSALAANSPLHVTHRSSDGDWVFVETVQKYGWLPMTDIAWVDDAFMKRFRTGHYLAVTAERVAVTDATGTFRFRTGIGSILPATGVRNAEILIAVADEQRQAQLATAQLPAGTSAPFPLQPTPQQLATLIAPLLGQPYDWGGQFGQRDCSATIQDLFAPLGLWLPRNSSKQAEVGRVQSLADVPSAQRENLLLREGVPFLTLVAMPGHIMLYLGEAGGHAVLLHTIWGLRTTSILGQEGRWRIGRTVITTLEPGKEKNSLSYSITSLRDRLTSMNQLIEE